MSRRALFAVAVLIGAWACDGPVEPAWRLERPRVLGAEVTVVADPQRSSPLPGESFRVALVTASSATARSAFASHAIRVCPSDGNTTTFECAGPDLGFREEASAGGAGFDPALVVDPLPRPGEVAVFGMFCTGGAARIDPGALVGRCEDGAHGQELIVRVLVGGPANRIVTFASDALSLDGKVLGRDERSGCQGDAVVVIRADGGAHVLRMTLARESIEPEDTPLLSHLATHGDLDRLYTTPGPDGIAEVAWDAPKELGLPRETARFHAIVRDGRGSTTFTSGAVCLER